MSKLIIPIYSMRSYDTGKYSILKDGNFKLQINRMNWDDDVIVVPEDSSDLDEFLDLGIVDKHQVIKAKYGENAYETRKMFWRSNQKTLDTLRMDIVTDITGYNGTNNFINNFNISADPKNPRWYIDEFLYHDIDAIKLADKTYVLNHSQKKFLVSCDPNLEDKIEVSTKVITKKYFDKVGTEKIALPDFDVFWPFRISDPCYRFDDTIQNNSTKTFLITDPNDSYNAKYPNVIKKRFTKRQFYGIIEGRPEIIYNENPNMVFHPGLADFLYFGCPITSDYHIPTLEEVLIDENTINFY